jgi:hypothetical protein
VTRYTPLWEQQGSYAASVDRRLMGALWPGPASTGCAVTVSSGMTVNVAAGTVAVPTANNTGTVLCASDAVEPVTLAAAPGSGTNRYDLIICQARGNDLDGLNNNDFLFTTVTGTAAASPTVPAVPSNAVALAQIYVPGGSASVTAGNIVDKRPSGLTVPSGQSLYYARAWRNAALTTGSGAVLFDTVNYDPAGMYTAGNGRFTVPVAGWYDARVTLSVVAGAGAQIFVGQLQRNGVVAAAGTMPYAAASGNVLTSAATDIIQCAAGDYLTGVVSYNPNSLPMALGTYNTFMSVQWVHS